MALESECEVIRELIWEMISEIRKLANDVPDDEGFKSVSGRAISELMVMEYLTLPGARSELMSSCYRVKYTKDLNLEYVLSIRFMLKAKVFELELYYQKMVYLLSKRGAFNTQGIENPKKELTESIYFL